jgi:hypothetical protein
MSLHDLVTTHLPKAVIASVIILLFNIYTGETTVPVRIGTEFILYILAIFIGFVIFDIIQSQ